MEKKTQHAKRFCGSLSEWIENYISPQPSPPTPKTPAPTSSKSIHAYLGEIDNTWRVHLVGHFILKYYCACTPSGVYSPVACCCKHPVLILRSVTIKTFQENVDEKHTIFFSISLPTNDHATRSYTRLYSLALQEGTATLLINKTTCRRPKNTFLYIGAARRSKYDRYTIYVRTPAECRPTKQRARKFKYFTQSLHRSLSTLLSSDS